MPNELVLNEIIASWQEHAVEMEARSLAEIHRRAHSFQRSVRFWNAFQYTTGTVGILAYGTFLVAHPSLRLAIGSVLIIAACLFDMCRIHRQRSARTVPEDFGTLSCLEFHRAELERQRAFLMRSWRYLLLPLPGVVVLMITDRPISGLAVFEFGVLFTLMIFGVVLARRRQAQMLQRELAMLEGNK